MATSSTEANVENLVRLFNDNANELNKQISAADHHQWIENSVSFRQITEAISSLSRPVIEPTKETKSADPVDNHENEKNAREIKLYSKEHFRSHINRLYPFHLDYFSNQLSSLDFDQHRMGLYIFYDVNQGYLSQDIEKESTKKSNRGKNMKRMNGLLLNEHRMFNQCAKEYAIQHLSRDYQAMKTPIKHFMQTWLQRKTDRLLKSSSLIGENYSSHLNIPLNSYDSLTPVTFANHSTILRLGNIPLLTIPEKIDQLNVKCSDNHDGVVANRFNPEYRLTNLSDDPNILVILSQNPSIDVVLCKSSLSLLIELFSNNSSAMTLPISIREFQYETVENPANPKKKKVIFIDKSLRQRSYTKRELNGKYCQRSFRSLLLSTTGGKREANNNPFHYIGFTDKVEFPITEITLPVKETPTNKETPAVTQQNDDDDDDDDDEDDDAMVISTDGDAEEQQKLFQKSKKKIIQSAPILQERTINPTEENDTGPVPILSRVKLVTPVQGNYEYCLWQLGTLQILIRSSFHGFLRHQQSNETNSEELISCYAKLEYQPQFGCEQITDEEYRLLWLQSYLRHGTTVLLGRINVFTQQLLKVEKMTYQNIEQNLKECQIDMLKPLTKVYGLLYGLQSLETKKYLLSKSTNEEKISLYQSISSSKESNEKVLDLRREPMETNELLVGNDDVSVPWIPLTPTLLLPYHLDFERIPLTFCPRNKRCYDIELTIPPYRRRRNVFVQEEKSNEEKKKRKKNKKKKAQQRKKKNLQPSKESN